MHTHHSATARDHCLAPSRGRHASGMSGSYRRMFPELSPLECDQDLIFALGGSCGGSPPQDANDASGAAGWPFFGQFVAHDITADRSPLQERADARALRNFRSPRADLECLYSAGPAAEPYLYDRDDPAKFLLGTNDRGEQADVPRNAQGIALVGDPRNDSHLLMSQLHLAFLKAHNRIVDRLRAEGVAEAELFEQARRLLTWHYQWIIVREFLPLLVGQELVDELLAAGPCFYRPQEDTFIPLEFADAAYRYGHSQIRDAYAINDHSEPVPVFPDLIGFRPVPHRSVVDWSYLFDMPGGPAKQKAKKLDTRLPPCLIELPTAISGQVEMVPYRSLAVRDLQRGQAVGLPSGEAVARRIGAEPLTPEEDGVRALGWDTETPLWYYILREAQVRQHGERLGEVGGRIVGEVLFGIIARDEASFLSVSPEWQPSLPHAGPAFTLGDLLAL